MNALAGEAFQLSILIVSLSLGVLVVWGRKNNPPSRHNDTEALINCGFRIADLFSVHSAMRNPQSAIVREEFPDSSRLKQRSRLRSGCLLAVGLLGFLSVRSSDAEEIDRVLASVNGIVIAESDLCIAHNLNTLLLFGRSPQETNPTREEQISRLIDLDLIRQELENLPLEPAEQSQVEAQVEELKGGYAEIGGIAAILRRLGLHMDELQSYLRLQASIMRFVSLRFRPFVSVSPEEVQSYYREKLLPRLQQTKSPIPALEQVSAGIENILKEEKVNAALDTWIKEIRSHSRIELFAEKPAVPGQEGGSGCLL